MKQSPSEMSTSAIERELEKFAWEYIAASDKAQTDDEYSRLASALDERKAALESEVAKRANTTATPESAGTAPELPPGLTDFTNLLGRR